MRDYSLPDMTGRTILQVIPDLSAGGAERTVIEMAEAIVMAGGEALVASRGGRLEVALTDAGGELIEMNAKSKNPFVLQANTGKLVKLIRERGVSLVHARSRAPAWSALAASNKANIPFVTTYHGAYSGKSALKIRYNSVMARGDIVIANSEWTAAHVRDVHGVDPTKLVTIPRGVDLDVFAPSAVSPERIEAARAAWRLDVPEGISPLVLLLPARLTDWKGHRVAIEAVSRLSREEQAGVRLVLAGDPQGRDKYVDTLEDLILEHGLGGVVKLAAHWDDMPAAYLAADIILQPSTRPEAFGRVAAEAAAMGRPVIAADHGGARETVVEGLTGARVKPGDASELAGAIRAIRDIGVGGRKSMGEAGMTHVGERFSKRGLQIATLRVYAGLLGEDSRA